MRESDRSKSSASTALRRHRARAARGGASRGTPRGACARAGRSSLPRCWRRSCSPSRSSRRTTRERRFSRPESTDTPPGRTKGGYDLCDEMRRRRRGARLRAIDVHVQWTQQQQATSVCRSDGGADDDAKWQR